MKIELVIPNKIPISEIDPSFFQKMVNSLSNAFFNYGPAAEAFPTKVNAIESLELRLAKYKETGNRDWLVDLANFAKLEYDFPAHPKAHYKETSRNESPGRVWNKENEDEIPEVSKRMNDNSIIVE